MSASSVSFAWADSAAVHAWSVVEITSGKLYEKDGKPTPGGLRDARLGTSRRGRCVTCGEGWEKCPGHFGHLELAEPVKIAYAEEIGAVEALNRINAIQ